MRTSTLIVFLLATTTVASASDHGLKTSLEAEIRGQGSDVVLRVTNASDKTYCFFSTDRVVGYETDAGVDVPTAANDLDTFGSAPSDVQVLWNDGRTYSFSLFTGLSGKTFDSVQDARRIARVTYFLAAYDCATLFKHRYGTVEPLFVQKVTVSPTFLPEK